MSIEKELSQEIDSYIEQNHNLPYAELADLINDEFGVELETDAIRKRYRRLDMPHKRKNSQAEKAPSSRVNTTAKTLGLSDEEAVAILKSAAKGTKRQRTRKVPIRKKSFKFGVMSDAHIGHSKFHDGLFDYMARYMKEENVDFIIDPGDHLEGMSGRPGHVYELSETGFNQQFEKCLRLYGKLDWCPIYGIDGNHDQWYYKKNNGGIIVGAELERELENYHHLGQDEGDIEVQGVKIKLFHPGDGTAYATSYKLQKLIESFSGGEKPHIVLEGHYHKAMYMFCRGVHGFECGTLCGQSQFMRGKKIPAHMGFWIITVVPNKNGVERIVPEFIPWHEK